MIWLGLFATACWGGAAALYAFKRRVLGDVLALAGILAGVGLLAWLWVSLQRPPLRTLGETRWWFALATPLVGLAVGWRFDTRLITMPACLMGAVFAGINLLHPEYMDRTLMPALQSPWFVPHVVLNLLSYSALGLGSVMALWTMARRRFRREELKVGDTDLPHKLVLVGLPLMTCGLAFGAFWAKEAWGHYWSWDPKETWAFVTWCAYLGYLHVRVRHAVKPGLNLSLLAGAFVILLITWFGVTYMPSANESVHTYAQQ